MLLEATPVMLMRMFLPAHPLDIVKSRPKTIQGFTLIEMAIVLIIVGLLLGGLLMPLSAQMDQRNYNSTQRSLAEIKEALMGYAMSHPALDGKPYLPCPDTDGDGVENRAVNACANQEGTLPWVDLGLTQTDSWNNVFRYRVRDIFSNSATGFTLASTGNITVKDASGAGGNNLASNVPAIILSQGKNGAGAGNDELENANNDTTFVSHVPSSVAGNEFDDIVVWIPTVILINRMVVAGQLP